MAGWINGKNITILPSFLSLEKKSALSRFDPIVKEPNIKGFGLAIPVVDDLQDFAMTRDDTGLLDAVASVAAKLEKRIGKHEAKDNYILLHDLNIFLRKVAFLITK
eukprot:gene8253-14200_t